MPGERVAELRIHGVSGGQAEELLDVEPVIRVAGDGLAGWFRWRRAVDTEVVSGVPREIFAWGNLTSGRASRALWLLLLPFMLVNIAYWMRPSGPGERPSPVRRTAGALYGLSVRLLALSLTALLTLAAAGIGMDLVAWQCSGHGAQCAELRPWLGFLSAPGATLAEPGRALAVGALLPLATVALLWRLSRRTARVYEVVDPPFEAVPHPSAPLSDRAFWLNSEVMARLRSVHIAVAVAMVAGLLLVPPLERDLSEGASTAGSVLAGALALTLALSVASALIPGTAPRWNRRADLVCRVLRDVSLLLLAGILVYTLWPRAGWEASGGLPGYAVALLVVFAVQCALALLMVVATALLRTAGRGRVAGPAMPGMAGPATAALGALLGGVFSAAVVYQAAGLLGGCYYPGAEESGCIRLHVPAAYVWLQLVFALEAAVALGATAVLLVVVARRARRKVDTVTRDYDRGRDARRTREIAWARALGGVTEALPVLLAAVLLPAVVFVALTGYAVLTGQPAAPTSTGRGPTPVLAGEADWLRGTITFAVTMGAWLGALSLLGLVLLGRSAYRDRPTRQWLGVLWDIGTFWPRVAHPLAPPSYAERAVPQIVARVAGLTAHGTNVVLSGHSQGSVLAAATVWQLPERCRPRVCLITHGSPLSRLYARYFPAYFGPKALGAARGRVLDWHNLWRATDPIGGPIRQERGRTPGTVGFATPLPDPRHYDVQEGEALYPEIRGHSFYTRDPAYANAVAACVLTVDARAGATGESSGTAVAADAADRGADVEQVDQGGDER